MASRHQRYHRSRRAFECAVSTQEASAAHNALNASISAAVSAATKAKQYYDEAADYRTVAAYEKVLILLDNVRNELRRI